MKESWHWKNIDNKIRDNIKDCLGNEWRAFGDTISIVRGEIPVTGNRAGTVSLSTADKIHWHRLTSTESKVQRKKLPCLLKRYQG
jgi:hypothetical protein